MEHLVKKCCDGWLDKLKLFFLPLVLHSSLRNVILEKSSESAQPKYKTNT